MCFNMFIMYLRSVIEGTVLVHFSEKFCALMLYFVESGL